MSVDVSMFTALLRKAAAGKQRRKERWVSQGKSHTRNPCPMINL
jgi:hypothetical protein